MQNNNLYSLVATRNRKEVESLGEVVGEVALQDNLNFEDAIKLSDDAVSLHNHLGAYPIFRKACIKIFKYIGGFWGIEREKPVFIKSLDLAVSEVVKFQKNYKPNIQQIQIELVRNVVSELSKIANYHTVGFNQEGELDYWEPGVVNYTDWCNSLSEKKAFVIQKNEHDDVSVDGLRIRLLCLTLDDRSLSFALYNRN